MDDLLKLAIEAHGGLERWRQFNEVRAKASITGALWHLKGQPNVLKNVQVVAQLHRQQLVTHLIGKDRRAIFSTGEVSIESASGVVEETRVDPTTLFRGHSLDSPWDAACSLLCELRAVELAHHPLPLHLSGFVSGEIAPWEADGEQLACFKSPFPTLSPATRGIKFRISVLTDCWERTDIPSMCLAMLWDSTTPLTTGPPTDLWFHISAEYLPTTAKAKGSMRLCSSRSKSMRSNST
jgi:hypothetical protein